MPRCLLKDIRVKQFKIFINLNPDLFIDKIKARPRRRALKLYRTGVIILSYPKLWRREKPPNRCTQNENSRI